MLEFVDMLSKVATEDRTLEPIAFEMICTIADARELKRSYENACKTIADMHAAAVGEARGPTRGVVEDVQDLRTALEVMSTSDAFFRKATADALKRIETLEREIEVTRALVKRYVNYDSSAQAHSAYCALVVWSNEE
jgi:hypothetical protein